MQYINVNNKKAGDKSWQAKEINKEVVKTMIVLASNQE